MELLARSLALNGALVVTTGLIAGLFLHRAIRLDGEVAAWHLAHAGTSGRGLLLLALAGIFRWVDLPPWQLCALVWLMLFFVWTSVAAMAIAAATGHRGVRWSGTTADKTVFGLYIMGAVAVFPAAFLLIAGLLRAL